MKVLSKVSIAIGLSLASLVAAQAAGVQHDPEAVYKPTGRGHGEIDEQATAAGKSNNGQAQFSAAKVAATNGISYHGGPVMTANTNVYYIWYGSWTTAQKNILIALAQGLGGTPIFNINTSYKNSAGVAVKNVVTLAAQSSDNYSLGKSLSDANIKTIVSNAISGGALPKDSNGVYFVLTAADVNETSGFGTQYCGWHNHASISSTDIKYAFVGNPATIAPAGCGVNSPSPNGDGGVDAMTSVVYHELSETVSDPDLNAWYDSTGAENADKCAWTFGTTFKTSSGATANVSFNSRNWLLQQNWVNASGGYCALSY